MRRGATAALALWLCLALGACGGGGGSSSTQSATQGQRAPGEGARTEAKRLPGHPRLSTEPPSPRHGTSASEPHPHPYGTFTRQAAKAAERKASQRQQARHRRLARAAGKAAPFLVAVGDNSIPTYGREASASEQSQAEAGLRAYLGAREAGDWSAACEAMAAPVRKQLALLAGEAEGAGGCPAAYAKLAERIPASARRSPLSGSLAAFREEGGKGFALWVGPREQQWMMPMVAEGGGWKVGQIEAVAWPVGSSPGQP